VTLVRLVLVCALGVHVLGGGGASWVFLVLALVALALDGVDGWLARRQGLASAFGARFDVEVDALMALVLAVNAALNPQIGMVAVLLGLPRYAFILASQGLPWLRGPLPERFSRKVVCVMQLAALIALQAPILPPLLAVGLMGAAALALLWSFAVDILWLWRARA
jgi:phosphatidylglycerophosphate synthase